GTIVYRMDGEALSAFPYAKIGICIHQPIDESAGRPYRGRGPDGEVGGILPDLIGPQIHVTDGTDLPLFDPVDHLEIDTPGGGTVAFDFEGDLFEMEDQRNWTDGSFKIYSTPARLGYRFEATAAQRIRQQVTVRIRGIRAVRPRRPAGRSSLSIGRSSGTALPAIGLGMA